MRKSIYMLLAMAISLFAMSCGNDAETGKQVGPAPKASEQIATQGDKISTAISDETQVPAPQWVADILKNDPDQSRVIECTSKGVKFYLITTCVDCKDSLTEVFDEDRKIICTIGGPTEGESCNTFLDANSDRQCKAVFLKEE